MLSWLLVSPHTLSSLTSVSNLVPCVTHTCFSLQVQHVYPTQVQYVEGGDAVYANGAMYVCSVRALVAHRLTTPLLSHSHSLPPQSPRFQFRATAFVLLASRKLIKISNQATGP